MPTIATTFDFGDVALGYVPIGTADRHRIDAGDGVGGLLDGGVGDVLPGSLPWAVEAWSYPTPGRPDENQTYAPHHHDGFRLTAERVRQVGDTEVTLAG